MNVMLVSVAERTHEIGIRKAVGATNVQILSQFMIEATLLSLGGGLIGIGLAYAIDGSLRVATNLQPSISWQIVVGATVVTLLIGVVFGTVPAFKAARKHPIEALRSSKLLGPLEQVVFVVIPKVLEDKPDHNHKPQNQYV